jgi:dephospho-CoA kinase
LALRVGLTGGIACGKSAVLRHLQEAGFSTVDLDAVAHALLAPEGQGYRPVLAAFGEGILKEDGTIDRKALGALVFASEPARLRLNAIVHPLVLEEEARRAAAAGDGVFVTDGALLVESGMHLRFDRLVVVHCPEEEQLRRLEARDGLSREDARARIAAQMPLPLKRTFAHLEVYTSGSLDETASRTDEVARSLRALPERRPQSLPGGAAAALLRGPRVGAAGLSPLDLLREIAVRGGLEMERVRAILHPARPVPWYRAGREGFPGAETLVLPLVLEALAQGRDRATLAGAAGSLGLLTHGTPEERAGAVAASLFLLSLAHGAPSDLEGAWPGILETARRHGEPPERLRDLPGALRARLASPGEGDFIAGAAALASGGPEEATPEIREAIARLRPS